MRSNWDKNKGLLLFLGIIIIFVVGVIIFLKEKEKDYSVKDFKNYKANEVIKVYVTDEEIARKYLTEYVHLIIDNAEEAYDLLSDNYKKNYYQTLDSFKKYIQSLLTVEFINAKLIKYSYYVDDGKKVMDVIDSDNNNIRFIENSLMDYQVEIN